MTAGGEREGPTMSLGGMKSWLVGHWAGGSSNGTCVFFPAGWKEIPSSLENTLPSSSFSLTLGQAPRNWTNLRWAPVSFSLLQRSPQTLGKHGATYKGASGPAPSGCTPCTVPKAVPCTGGHPKLRRGQRAPSWGTSQGSPTSSETLEGLGSPFLPGTPRHIFT